MEFKLQSGLMTDHILLLGGESFQWQHGVKVAEWIAQRSYYLKSNELYKNIWGHMRQISACLNKQVVKKIVTTDNNTH